ncbi:MAG: SH3 domain-containing protein [Caldilineaceae bacterium]|nr:SH3 domain-containing protein [Caldilineaceae bacterium]
MVQPRLVQVLILFVFIGSVVLGLFFLLRSQVASLLVDVGGGLPTTARRTALPTVPNATPTATLQPLTLALVATSVTSATVESAAPTLAASAATVRTGLVNSEAVNVRSYPDLVGEVVGQVQKGERLEILATSADEQWLQVCCPLGTNEGNRQSWIAASFIDLQPDATTTTASNTTASNSQISASLPAGDTVTGVISSSLVNLRDGPGTNYAVVGQASEQTTIQLTGRNEAGSWWRICCPPNAPSTSWISAELVTISLPQEEVLARVPVVAVPAPPVPTPTDTPTP